MSSLHGLSATHTDTSVVPAGHSGGIRQSMLPSMHETEIPQIISVVQFVSVGHD